MLRTLRNKHPTENPPVTATSKTWVEQRAEITALGEQEQQVNMTAGSLIAQGQIPEMENLFALCYELVEDLAALAALVFSNHDLPQVFWTLHTSANISAFGQKARPVACSDTLRRVIGAILYHLYSRKLADYF